MLKLLQSVRRRKRRDDVHSRSPQPRSLHKAISTPSFAFTPLTKLFSPREPRTPDPPAGVIYGTRTHDWGTPETRFARALRKSKSVFALSQTSHASRHTDALGISIAPSRQSRFSFDSSVVPESLLRNGSNASGATHFSVSSVTTHFSTDRTPIARSGFQSEFDQVQFNNAHEYSTDDLQTARPSIDPMPFQNKSYEDELSAIDVPFEAHKYSSAELADMTAFDFTDGYDDMLIDEVNMYDEDDDDDEYEHDRPSQEQGRHVVAYVRGRKGWVVERRIGEGDVVQTQVKRGAI
ncbi:hypothetical protein V1512DRAFT_267501 [Lipomyces arxii]|uniref:uncharacterized protein n=1 Tax=Lipomyces arxii TaxID=56418 RepID=UPI0034CFE14A